MRMLNQKNKQTNRKKIRKSHICLFGSLLVIIGISILLFNHVKELKEQLFSDMQLKIDNNISDEIVEDIPEVEEKKETQPEPQEEKKNRLYKIFGSFRNSKNRIKTWILWF